MSFDIVIKNISAARLGPFLSELKLPKGAHFELLKKPNGAAEPKRRGKKRQSLRPNADSLLTMTGKVPQPGTAIEYARNLFEKLEAKHGIGNVSVHDLRTALSKNRKPWQLQTRLVTEKFLTYIDE